MSVRQRDAAETKAASSEALKGAISGGAKYGAVTALITAVCYGYFPAYRRLTLPFKCFIQMSGMTFGAVIEADRRVRAYEFRMQAYKRMKADQRVWQEWQSLVQEEQRLRAEGKLD